MKMNRLVLSLRPGESFMFKGLSEDMIFTVEAAFMGVRKISLNQGFEKPKEILFSRYEPKEIKISDALIIKALEMKGRSTRFLLKAAPEIRISRTV